MRYMFILLLLLFGCSQDVDEDLFVENSDTQDVIDEDLFVKKLQAETKEQEGILTEAEFADMNRYNLSEREYKRYMALNLNQEESVVYINAMNCNMSEKDLIGYYQNDINLSIEEYADYLNYLEKKQIEELNERKKEGYEEIHARIEKKNARIKEQFNLTDEDYNNMQEMGYEPDEYLYYKKLVYELNVSPSNAKSKVVFYSLNRTIESDELKTFDSLRIETEHPLELLDYGYEEDMVWGKTFQFRLKRLEYDDYLDLSGTDNYMLTVDGSIHKMSEVSSQLESPYRIYKVHFLQAYGGDTLDDTPPRYLLFGGKYVFDIANEKSFIYEY